MEGIGICVLITTILFWIGTFYTHYQLDGLDKRISKLEKRDEEKDETR